jgi:hypothetical protein
MYLKHFNKVRPKKQSNSDLNDFKLLNIDLLYFFLYDRVSIL